MSTTHRIQALQELLCRYRDTFKHFWRLRHENDGGLFNVEEAEFLPAALSLQEKPVSHTARFSAQILMCIVLFLLAWACIGKMDIVVNAAGKVIASGYSKSIASIEVAAVRALHVREGQAVRAGDILVELDSSSVDAEHLKSTGMSIEANLQVARSQALIDSVDNMQRPSMSQLIGASSSQWLAAKNQLDAQYNDFRSKLNRVDSEVTRYTQTLKIASQRAMDYKELVKHNDVPYHSWQEKEQIRIDTAGQLSDARNQRLALIAQTRREAWEALVEGRKTAALNIQDAQRAAGHSKLLKLVSPVDGTVQQLNVHTVGGVVSAAQSLMLIVPAEKQIEIEAFLENKDRGFVREGQRVSVKIDAFDYAKYGTLPAFVTHVSQDAIQDEKKGLIYSTRVLLDNFDLAVDGKKIPIAVGMSVNVEMKTGERRVIEYFLSPLIQHGRESLSER